MQCIIKCSLVTVSLYKINEWINLWLFFLTWISVVITYYKEREREQEKQNTRHQHHYIYLSIKLSSVHPTACCFGSHKRIGCSLTFHHPGDAWYPCSCIIKKNLNNWELVLRWLQLDDWFLDKYFTDLLHSRRHNNGNAVTYSRNIQCFRNQNVEINCTRSLENLDLASFSCCSVVQEFITSACLLSNTNSISLTQRTNCQKSLKQMYHNQEYCKNTPLLLKTNWETIWM